MQLKRCVLAVVALLALLCFVEAGSLKERLAQLSKAASAKPAKKLIPFTPAGKAELDKLVKLAGTDKDPNLPSSAPVTSPEFQYEWPPRPKTLYPMTPSEQAAKMSEDSEYRDINYGFTHEQVRVPKSVLPVTPRQVIKATDKMRHLRIKQMNAYQLNEKAVDDLLSL